MTKVFSESDFFKVRKPIPKLNSEIPLELEHLFECESNGLEPGRTETILDFAQEQYLKSLETGGVSDESWNAKVGDPVKKAEPEVELDVDPRGRVRDSKAFQEAEDEICGRCVKLVMNNFLDDWKKEHPSSAEYVEELREEFIGTGA